MQELSRKEVLEIVRVAREKGERPNFSRADLTKANLAMADLSGADLFKANLFRTNLIEANLSGAYLGGADFGGANLGGADLTQANLSEANLRGADLNKVDLSKADLSKADLSKADLSEANLFKANLTKANLMGAKLHGANLTAAYLTEAHFIEAYLTKANLRAVHLRGADFSGAYLSGANFQEAYIGWNKFGDTDLSNVEGLDAVYHRGPSTIGIDTIYRSNGKIPEAFLRGAGVPDTFITYIASLTGQAIQYYSCFISYSSKDEEFAQRLHNDLQAKGVRCWFAPEDLKIGAKIRPTIDETIRLHDKLLLVLSEHSVTSQWVEQEVETALARERKQDETVLFPIRLDNMVMEMEGGWPALIKNTRNIGDFCQWKEHDAYQKGFSRLLRDLKAEG
jgi:uncharacterized protein YjbI with pentapeptide repeats